MKNFRLRILLEKTPLTEEDKYNISIIFEALSFSRQQTILDNWEPYIARILELRKQADEEYLDEAVSTLKNINILLDEAIIREYIARILELRKQADEEYLDEAVSTLKNINILLDEAIIREQEKEAYKASKKAEIRKELESTVAYGQMQKLRKIKEVSKIPT